jgi:hypothetical protein
MRRIVLSLLSVCAFGTLLASASAQTPIGTANFIEWDIPATAGQPPAALEVRPIPGGRDVVYVTEGTTQPPRLVRFTPGTPIGTAPATWRSWNYGAAVPSNAPTGGLKFRENLVFIRDSLAITRANTGMNNRVRYVDGLGSRSDLAEDMNNVWTAGPAAGGGVLQRLAAGVSVGTIRRWAVGGGAGSVYLSGVAAGPGPAGQRLIYYSEPTSNMIGQLNPVNNNVRRWLLPAGVTQPRQLDLDAQGNVWVVTGSGHLVRLNPATNMVTPYLIPTPGSNPMGVGPDGLIGFTETGTNKVGMLIPDGTQVPVTPTNQIVTPTNTTVPGVTAPMPFVDGTAAPIAKTGPATSSGTAATGIFVEAQLPVAPPPPSTTPLAIEDDTVQPSVPTGAFGRAFFYSLGNPVTNRIGRVELVRPAPEPTTLDLNPPTAINPVDSEHCVTATVRDQYGEPMPGINVEFRVTGAVMTSGEANTDNDGEAEFCYTGPAFPGADAIHAWADWNPDNDMQDAGEPFDDATKTWVFPVSTPGCEVKITNGGWIIAANGDRASFGGNAKVDADGNVSGQEEYQDHGPAQPFNAHGNVLVVTCTPNQNQATIFGTASVDGQGSHLYRIDVRDLGEPGVGQDTYRFRLEATPFPYDSGDQVLKGGNVQIHNS